MVASTIGIDGLSQYSYSLFPTNTTFTVNGISYSCGRYIDNTNSVNSFFTNIRSAKSTIVTSSPCSIYSDDTVIIVDFTGTGSTLSFEGYVSAGFLTNATLSPGDGKKLTFII